MLCHDPSTHRVSLKFERVVTKDPWIIIFITNLNIPIWIPELAQNMEPTDSDTYIQCSSSHILAAPLIMVDHFLRSTVLVRIQFKVEASIVDQVHLTTHKGHVMPTWKSTFFTRMEFMFMWWPLVIVDPHKNIDNRYNQALTFRWVVIS